MEGQRRCEGIRVELLVRGEALGFVKDEQLRNHVPRTVFIDQERKLEETATTSQEGSRRVK